METITNLFDQIESTPSYLFDQECFETNLRQFRIALENHYSNIIIGYSFKTNYTPKICEVAKHENCWAEVVSTVELELAEALNFSYGKIIFNGPFKTKEDLLLAIRLGAIIHFDSLDQISEFCELDVEYKQQAKVGLRANVDLTRMLSGEQNKVSEGGTVPRFGLSEEDFQEAVDLLVAQHVKIISLHGHCSSSDRDPQNYSMIARHLLYLRESASLKNIEYIDVGGGFFGELPDIWGIHKAPSFGDYANAIFSVLCSDDWFNSAKPNVIIEPGMSVIANAISYVTKVIGIKKIRNQNIVMVDGSYYDVRPTMHKKQLQSYLIRSDLKSEKTDLSETKNSFSFLVVGSTCMERDILLYKSYADRLPKKGDYILVESVGAYCGVLSPNFILYAASIYGYRKHQGELQVEKLRAKQEFHHFFNAYTF